MVGAVLFDFIQLRINSSRNRGLTSSCSLAQKATTYTEYKNIL